MSEKLKPLNDSLWPLYLWTHNFSLLKNFTVSYRYTLLCPQYTIIHHSTENLRLPVKLFIYLPLFWLTSDLNTSSFMIWYCIHIYIYIHSFYRQVSFQLKSFYFAHFFQVGILSVWGLGGWKGKRKKGANVSWHYSQTQSILIQTQILGNGVH